MINWLFGSNNKDDYKKTDEIKDLENDIKIDIGRFDNDEDSDSGSDTDTDIFLTQKISKYKTKYNYSCCHYHTIDTTNIFFNNNYHKLFSVYLENRPIPDWMMNLLNIDKTKLIKEESEEEKNNQSNKYDSFGLNHYGFDIVILDENSFMINRDMYNTITCNFCIMGIYNMKSYSLNKTRKYHYIKRLNNLKMTCSCSDLNNIIAGIDTKNKAEFLLVTTQDHDYHKKNQTINYQVPNEIIALVLSNSNIQFNTKIPWVFTNLSSDAYYSFKSKIKSSSSSFLLNLHRI